MTTFSCQKDIDNVDYQIAIKESIVESRADNERTVHSLERADVSPPNCNYGSFSIVNGMIRFEDFDSFIETFDFLSCASQADYEAWQQQIQIQTVKKQFDEFYEQINSASTSEEEENIRSQYGEHITVQDDGAGAVTYKSKYLTHKHFRNTDGLFLIGDRIMAEYKNTRISILNGDWSILDDIKSDPNYPENLATYIDFENVLIERHDLISCCDAFNKEVHYYDDGDKRITSSYSWIDLTESERLVSGWYVYPRIQWTVTFKSEQKRNPAILGWKDHNRHWSFVHDAIYYVVPDEPKWESDQNTYGVEGDAWTANVSGEILIRLTTRGPYPEPTDGAACVFSTQWDVNLHQVLDGPVEEDMTLHCTPEHSLCEECPDGWTYNSGSCYSGICAVDAFVWGNGMWYPSVNGQCNQGTYNAATGSCYIGWFPSGYGLPFVWGDCFWIGAGCPWD